jgi:hypothetical protein
VGHFSRRRFHLALATALLSPVLGHTQQVIETPEGRAEVIGLKRWTAAMLADSLGLRAPGVSLFQTRECTKALTDRLHFRSVFIEKEVRQGMPGAPALSVVIRVVEPQDSGRIHWAVEPRDSQPDRAEWSELRRALTDSTRGAFREGDIVNPLGLYGVFLTDTARGTARNAGALAATMGLDSARAHVFWTALRRLTDERDRKLAIRTLRGDRNRRNRMIAAAVLANFPASDEAWRALAESLRDPYPGVSAAALQSISLLGNGFARVVDWAPAAEALRAILDGTNLPAFLPLIRVLVQTRVAPAEAAALLGGGGELLLAHADAADRRSHDAARALLLQLSGRTAAPTSWRLWVETL